MVNKQRNKVNRKWRCWYLDGNRLEIFIIGLLFAVFYFITTIIFWNTELMPWIVKAKIEINHIIYFI
jgi:hypothetical protein